jgi:N6-adenosine-specific RNA methylase IME4
MAYNIIVVDPPWPIKKLTHSARPNQTTMDYSVMDVAQIGALPIGALAAEECLCFLWTTQKYLWGARAILEGWGFHQLLTMVWEKTYGRSAGMALYGFRWNAEFILVGYNKKPELWPKRKLIPAVFQSENWHHSEKPDKFYDMIQVLGEQRIDVFARKRREGWTCIGNEIDGLDIRAALALHT